MTALINIFGFLLIWGVIWYANNSTEKISYRRPIEFIVIALVMAAGVSLAGM